MELAGLEPATSWVRSRRSAPGIRAGKCRLAGGSCGGGRRQLSADNRGYAGIPLGFRHSWRLVPEKPAGDPGGRWPGDHYGSGAPTRAATTPTAPAPSSVSTTPSRRASSAMAATARTPTCQRSLRAPASGIAAPRMAPIAAGPAPSRNARALAFPRSRSNRWPPSRMNENEGV